MNDYLHIPFICFILSLLGLTEGSHCYVDSGWSSYYEYCAFGCCGYSSYRYCCSTTWHVIGILLGCGAVISIIVTIICCCRRSQGSRGMVCRPNPNATATTVVTSGGQVQTTYPAQTVVTYPVQPSYPAYPAAYQQPYVQQPYVQQPYVQQPYAQYPQTAQAGMVGSSVRTYTDQPDVKASAPPMEPPPPYPQ